MHTVDGGKTWSIIEGFGRTGSVGMGKAERPGGPATYFARGYYKDEIGTWRSTDEAKTWIKIGTHPRGIYHMSEHMAGDWERFGVVYLGLRGNGFAYGEPIGSTPASP
jgi:hypothetical protein